jgi:hypothetical protein
VREREDGGNYSRQVAATVVETKEEEKAVCENENE